MSQSTIVSAPGKVLLAGGYLVLDPLYSGLVLATSSRFYTIIRPSTPSRTKEPDQKHELLINVRAGQFPQNGSEWTFAVIVGSAVEVRAVGLAKNKFVQITLDCALRYALERLNAEFGEEGSKELLKRVRGDGHGNGLDIVVLADNDFYSQRETLTSLGLPIRISSISQIPPFSPLPRPIHETNKTGLGSSAALVTSLTAALLAHLGIVSLPAVDGAQASSSLSHDQEQRPDTSSLDVVHSLAQYAHCLAQGKVGSGFDVSSAVYGTHIYRRFSPSLLAPLMDSSPSSSLLKHLDPTKWDSQARSFRLPRGLRLVLADVDAGTDTPSFVGKVLEWRKREKDEALRIWTSLDEGNTRLEEALGRLAGADGGEEGDRASYEADLRTAATKCIAELDTANSVHKNLVDIRRAFEDIRHRMRDMSQASNVPIEPPEQTRLLDKCCAVPGVVGGGVPGAGGFDAIFLLIVDDPAVLDRIEQVWSSWTEMSVCPLSTRQSDGGLRVESVEGVRGLQDALIRL